MAKLASRRIGARDAKFGDGSPVLSFSVAEWRVFTAQAKNGQFDLAE